MSFFSRWIRKGRGISQLIEGGEACKERQLIEEAESRKVERRDIQQAQAPLLTLYELQRTMDPLVAAQVYNNRLCPLISRLPEELLLCILDFLDDDAVALRCLRIVSRIFLRLLNYPPIFQRDGYNQYLQFRRLLQRDGRCNDCRRWNDAHKCGYYDDCPFQQSLRPMLKGDSISWLYRRLYCYACQTLHNICQFSSTYQQSW